MDIEVRLSCTSRTIPSLVDLNLLPELTRNTVLVLKISAWKKRRKCQNWFFLNLVWFILSPYCMDEQVKSQDLLWNCHLYPARVVRCKRCAEDLSPALTQTWRGLVVLRFHKVGATQMELIETFRRDNIIPF